MLDINEYKHFFENENNETLQQAVEKLEEFLLKEETFEYEKIVSLIDTISSYLDPYDTTLMDKNLKHYIPIVETMVLRLQNTKDEHITALLDSLTYLYYASSQYLKALDTQEKSCGLKEELEGEKSAKTAKSYDLLGAIYLAQKVYEKAEHFYLKALQIREEILGEEHPDTATSYNSVAGLHESMGEIKKAKPLYEKVLSIKKSTLGETHPHTATSYHNLGLLYKKLKNCKEAKAMLEKVLNMVDKEAYNHLSTLELTRNIKEIEKSMKQEKKVKFKQRGRYCESI